MINDRIPITTEPTPNSATQEGIGPEPEACWEEEGGVVVAGDVKANGMFAGAALLIYYNQLFSYCLKVKCNVARRWL